MLTRIASLVTNHAPGARPASKNPDGRLGIVLKESPDVREGSCSAPKRTLDRLRSYPWLGNVRELQNVIERLVIVSDTDEFTVDESWLSAEPAVESRLGLSSTPAAYEKAVVEDALRASGGRVFGPSGAAARLGIPRLTLESKIRALRINRSGFRARATKLS
jgi:DNA-binding NtrC family response regulator